MTLPAVSGWIIDFRTARTIFASGSNQRIDHCIELCRNGGMFACHVDRNDFKSVPRLKQVFITDQPCICTPNDDVLKRCLAISESTIGKKRAKGNEAAVFIAATAAANDYGVISDHRSIIYSTVYDICDSLGLPVLSADEYFEAL